MSVAAPLSIDKIERFVDGFHGSRAERVHAALVEMLGRGTEVFVVMAELAWEVHEKHHWKVLRDVQGRPYGSENDYFLIALGLQPRHADNFQRVGKMIAGTPAARRAQFRIEVCDLGISKAVAIAPAIEQGGVAAIDEWVSTAKRVPYRSLRSRVSRSLNLKPHGTRPARMRFMEMLRARGVLPEQAEQAYDLGAKLHGSLEPNAMLGKIIEAAIITWRHR